MKKLLILVPAILLAGCTKTIMVPEPVAYTPPAILMEPPHKNNIIVKPNAVVVEGPKEEKK